MQRICLKYLSQRQREAWIMRYRYAWRLSKIAINMGISQGGVSKMLSRAFERAGLPKCRVSVIRTKPKRVRALYLSQIREPY
ncbi:MAG TPA: sigma factor-like helix-turn-helix DNA-binding protein [Tepidisphaeraceae bacterium]|nr:sigma factor-like helix-turn-helix DNA-binding protein [Tepidisphaeraceae bacterium]